MNWFSVTKLSGPDGVEAWCVALAACVINFVMAGLGRMSGILYVEFIDIFQIDRRDASLPFSVRASIRNLLGPVVGILGQKYGVRPVVITGAIIGSLSSAGCFYVKDILWVTILWGGVCGFGAALTTTLNQAVIGQHFKKYRTTAAGMAFSGGCVGSFLFPVLLEYLLHTYGLGGTFLIIAGILMNVIPAALVLKKPRWLNSKRPEIQVSTVSGDIKELSKETESKNTQSSMGHYGNDVGQNEFCRKNPTEYSADKSVRLKDMTLQITTNEPFRKRKIDTDLLWENRKLVTRLLTKDFTLKCPTSEIFQNIPFPNDNSMKEIEDLFNKICRDVYNNEVSAVKSCTDAITAKDNDAFDDKYIDSKNAPYSNRCSKSCVAESISIMNSNSINCLLFSLEKLFEADSKSITCSFPHSENISKILDELWYIYILLDSKKRNIYICSHSPNNSLLLNNNFKNIEGNIKQSNTFCSHIKTALKLYTKPIFVLICLCRTVHLMTFMPIVTTVVDFSMDKGLLEEDGKYVIAALSLGDLLGRLCLGWITDRGYVTLPRYMLFAMIIQAAFTATLSFMDTRATLLLALAAFGLFQGSIFVRHPVLVSRYLESNEQSIAMGCLNFFSGFLAFALPSYIGYFRDFIGSYNGMLYINGAVGATVGLLWVFEPNFVKLSMSQEKEHNQTPL